MPRRPAGLPGSIAGRLEPGEEQAFRAWLGEDVRCTGAYAPHAGAGAHHRTRACAGPGFRFRRLQARAPRWRGAPRCRLGGALAACGLIAVTGTWSVLRHRGRFSTGKGETKVIALKDGSVVTLNTASEIQVNYSDALRSVELIRGEALFDVAKNKARPFVVAAGDTSVRVVGTSFTVRHLDATPVQVLVREGIVDVFKPTTGTAPVRITANDMAVAPAGRRCHRDLGRAGGPGASPTCLAERPARL